MLQFQHFPRNIFFNLALLHVTRAPSIQWQPIMNENSHSSTSTNLSNCHLNFLAFNPFRIENGDNPTVALVSNLFDANNYVSWSCAISRVLRTNNKLRFIIGALPKPANSFSPLFEAWERCNDLMVSWLQNFVSASVKTSLALVDDSRTLWLELQD